MFNINKPNHLYIFIFILVSLSVTYKKFYKSKPRPSPLPIFTPIFTNIFTPYFFSYFLVINLSELHTHYSTSRGVSHAIGGSETPVFWGLWHRNPSFQFRLNCVNLLE